MQTAEAVAKATIRGVERRRKQVYPCPIYLPSRFLMNVLPPVRSLYLRSQQRMLLRFLERKQNDEREA